MDIVDSRYDAISDLDWLATLPISRLDEIATDGRCYLYGATTYYHPGKQMMFIVDYLWEAPATLGNVAYVRSEEVTYVCGKERWTPINYAPVPKEKTERLEGVDYKALADKLAPNQRPPNPRLLDRLHTYPPR